VTVETFIAFSITVTAYFYVGDLVMWFARRRIAENTLFYLATETAMLLKKGLPLLLIFISWKALPIALAVIYAEAVALQALNNVTLVANEFRGVMVRHQVDEAIEKILDEDERP